MAFYSENKTLFRWIIVLSTALFIGVGLVNYYRTISSPTDENAYREPPSRIYIDKSFPASLQIGDEKDDKNYLSPDSIMAGTLLVGINGSRTHLKENVDSLIDASSNDDKVLFTIFELTHPEFNSKANLNRFVNTYAVNKADIPESFYRKLSSAAMIIDVYEGGASDRAGLLIGDLITKINGNEFKNIFEADAYLRVASTGSQISYEILRKNNFIDLNVVLAKFGFRFFSIVIFLLSILMLSFALFIIIKRPQLKSARLLGGAFIILSYYYIFQANQINRPHTNYDNFSVLAFVLFLFSVMIGYTMLFHSFNYFPKELKKIKWKKYIYLVAYVLGVVLIAVSLYFTFSNEMSRFIVILSSWVSNIFVVLLYVLFFIFYGYSDNERKKLMLPVLIAVMIFAINHALIPITNLIFSLNSDFVQNMMLSFHMTFFLIPGAVFYVIGRHRLLDLDIKLRRSLIYTVTSISWKLLIAGMVILLIWKITSIEFQVPNIVVRGTYIEVLEKQIDPELNKIYSNIILIILSIFGAITIWKIDRLGQSILDKKFHRIRFDYRKASTEFSEILAKNLDISKLATTIVNELAQLIHLKRIGILFFKNEESIYGYEFYGFQSRELHEFCKAIESKLIKEVKEFKGEFRVDYLPQPMKDVFVSFEFKYLIPIRQKSKIVGVIFLGEKLSESNYTREDFEYLRTIIGQLAVSIENSLLYEELTQQERIKHELNLARRIQLASLPQDIPQIPGLDISGISIPAFEVGGDFFDYLEDESHRLTVIVGDVSGKGTSAALYMSKAQGIIRTLYEFERTPKRLFSKANELLYKYIDKSSFISALGLLIDSEQKSITLARAGHLPLYYFSALSNEIIKLTPKGMVLGMTKDGLFEDNLEEMKINYNSGDVFVMVTDGVLEARNHRGLEFEEDKLMSIILQNVNNNSNLIRDSIIESVNGFAGDAYQYDDMSIVVIKAK